MDFNELLLFRGRALQEGPELPLFVFVDEPRKKAEGGGALELAGSHACLVASALELASLPTLATELASSIARGCGVEQQFALELLDHLLEQDILLSVVPAADRLQTRGDRALSNALRLQMKSAIWPRRAPGCAVWGLGTLGSPSWRESFHESRESTGSALSWSLEGDGAWIGPVTNRGRGPCPGCLVAWRTAVKPAAGWHENVVAHAPLALSLLCQRVLLRAEEWGAGQLKDNEVLYVSASEVAVHTLLRQPGCPYCVSSIARLAPRDQALEAQFQADLAYGDGPEPPTALRAPFLDSALGPIELSAYDAPGLFRGLPLALGSLRMLLPRGNAFERRQMLSITFGAGMTESRRQLVAFAEGIERYALFIDQPDITGKRLSELGSDALSPSETVRFTPNQLSGKVGAPIEYEDQPLDWSWAYDLGSGRARLLAHDVFAADLQASPSAIRWLEDPFSSGAAAHRSLPRAMRRALLELIERDALMLAWYLRLPLPELDIPVAAARNPEIRELHEYLTGRGIELQCFDLRVDFDVPTILLSARARLDCGQWRAGGRIVSPSASGSWDDAIAHSLHEILGHYSAFALVAPDGDSSIDPATGEPHLWWSNFAAYFKPRPDNPLSFLGNGTLSPVPGEAAVESVSELLAKLQAELRTRELSAFIRYLAPDDIRESGLIAVRACVPGLVRMARSIEAVNFGEPRIEQIRARWRAPAGLNEHPHPIS